MWNVKTLFIVFIQPLKIISNFIMPQKNPALPTDFTSKMKRNMCNAKGNKYSYLFSGIGAFYYLNPSFAPKCPVPFGAIKFLAKGKLTAARY
jgi:hypothetical protein